MTVSDPISAYYGKVDDYGHFRLEYSRDAVRSLLDRAGAGDDWVIADIGCGTGHLTKHLLSHVRSVLAVEPNQEMREYAEMKLGNDPAFQTVDGTAESTGLGDQSVDMITVGQAIHWFEPTAAFAEFHRILKPGGPVGLVWNRFAGEPFPETEWLFEAGSTQSGSWQMSVTEGWEKYMGGARSAAAAPMPGTPEYADFEEKQKAFFSENAVNGKIALTYTTQTILGRVNPAV